MDAAVGDAGKTRWLILIYHLPREPSRHWVAVWRKLKGLGALYLQDGTVALPEDVIPASSSSHCSSASGRPAER